MTNPSGILFDLGDTILREKKYALSNGIWELIRISNVDGDHEEIHSSCLSLLNEIQWKFCSGNLEFNFKSFIKIFYDLFSSNLKLSADEVELIFWKATVELEPIEGVRNVLDRLAKLKIPMGIISNAIFSEQALRHELKKYELEKYFNFVMSSADYGIKKPNPYLFRMGLKKLGTAPERTWFVGDSYENDMVGAQQAGLIPVWKTLDSASHEFITIKFEKWDELTLCN